MASLYRQGKIRAIGVSNYSPSDMDRFRAVAPLHTDQPPYNLFERQIDSDVLPHIRDHKMSAFTYGSLCRGLLTGKMKADSQFQGDDLRKTDPKFQTPRFAQYLSAVERLNSFAQENFRKNVLDLALRWVLDQPGVTAALWGARHPEQLAPVDSVDGWHLDAKALNEIDEILHETVLDPVGPEFIAPPLPRPSAASSGSGT